MPYSPSNPNQDDILELTDVIEEGFKRPQDEGDSVGDSNLDDELNVLFSSQTKESSQSSQINSDNQNDIEDDLDLNSFFEEIEKRSENKDNQPSNKKASQTVPTKDKDATENQISKIREDTGQLQIDLQKLSARLESLEQSMINLTEKTTNPENQEFQQEDTSNFEQRLVERVQKLLDQRINTQVQEIVDNSLNKFDIPTIKEQIQEIRKETVKQREIESLRSELKEELSQYIQKKIPALAAQTIREEIRALTEAD